MANKISIFKTAELEAEYNSAYEAALQLWPVPYEKFYIATRFGKTHVIVSGSKGNAPLVLFHPAGCGAPIWYRNVEAFSRYYRTYAVDVMGEVNKSIPSRRISNRQELADWMEDLFEGLGITSAHLVGNSFGGFLTLNTILLSPARVEKAVLISPAATFSQIWAWWSYFFLHMGQALGACCAEPMTGSGRAFPQMIASLSYDASPELAEFPGIFRRLSLERQSCAAFGTRSCCWLVTMR